MLGTMEVIVILRNTKAKETQEYFGIFMFSLVAVPAWVVFQQIWSNSAFPLPASRASTRLSCTLGASRRPCLGRWLAGRGSQRWPPRWGRGKIVYSLPFHSDQPLGWQKLGKREHKEASRRLPFQTTGLVQCPYCVGGQSPDQHHNHGIKL